jgi:AcrR family transcriptional regulator
VDPARRAEIGRQRRAQTRAKIIAAAFEIFGDEQGLYARIEDIVEMAGTTRATFYNHFTGMIDLREALTHEVTHDFLLAVMHTVSKMPDPRDRSAVAIRFYLRRARKDRRWAWSMLNMSASGLIFGAETHRQAEQTVLEGITDGAFPVYSVDLGRDILMGASLAAVGTMIRKDMPEEYPEAVAGHILHALGVGYDEARSIAHQPLPELLGPDDQPYQSA